MKAAAVLSIPLFAAVACAQDSDAARWSLPEAGFSLELPEGWRVDLGSSGRPVISPSGREGRGASVNVQLATQADDADLELVMKQVLAEFAKANLDVHDARVRTLGKREGIYLDFSNPPGRPPVRYNAFQFQSPRGQITITCTSGTSDYEALAPVFARVLGSLQDLPARREPAAAERVSRPTWGLSVELPSDWIEAQPGSYWEAGRWVFPSLRAGKGRKPTSIAVFAEPKNGRTLDVFLAKEAKAIGARAEKAEVELGGTEARRLTGGAARLVVCSRGEVFYTLALLGEQDEAALAAFERARSSFRFTERGTASEQLGGPSRRVIVLPGRLALRLPSVVRPLARQEGQVVFAVHDWERNDLEFRLEVATVPLQDPSVTTEGIRDGVAANIKQRLNLQAPLGWRKSEADLEAFKSDLVGVKVESVEFKVAYCLVRLDRDSVAILTFNVRADPESEKRWRVAVKAICDSLRGPAK